MIATEVCKRSVLRVARSAADDNRSVGDRQPVVPSGRTSTDAKARLRSEHDEGPAPQGLAGTRPSSGQAYRPLSSRPARRSPYFN